MHSTLRRSTFALLLLATISFAYGSNGFDETFTFGDSLSDAGNFFFETGDTVRAPFEPVPGAPYAIGGHHFSNGRTWIEQLTTWLG